MTDAELISRPESNPEKNSINNRARMPMISNRFLLQLDRIYLERGADVLKVMKAAGLPYETLVINGLMVSFECHNRMLELSEKELDIKPIGLILARRQLVSHLQPMFNLLLSHSSVRGSVLALCENLEMVAQGLETILHEDNDLAYLQISTNNHYLMNSPVFQDHAAGLLAQYMRWIAGKKFRLQSVSLLHSEPRDLIRFRSFFGCPVSFGDSHISVAFDKTVLDQVIVGSAERMQREYNEVLEWDRAASLMAQLRSVIRTDLASGSIEIDKVAREMKLSTRTLQRRLSSKGSSFHKQLDSVRAGLARQLIHRKDLELSDVSAHLGYADQACFTRAFRRWYRQTPSDWRKNIASYELN